MFFILKSFLIHFTYVALIAVLVLTGLGLPCPEDIPLAFSGYLCNREYSPIAIEDENIPMIDTNGDGIPDTPNPHFRYHHVPHLTLMIIAGMIGVLLGDSIIFHIGRRGINGNSFVARHLRKVLHSKRREKVEHHFASHGNLTVFAGRFAPGGRSLVFVFAGMSKMSYFRFLLIDGMAAMISVPLFVWLGHHFAKQIQVDFFGYLDRQKNIVIPIMVCVLAAGILIYIVRRRRASDSKLKNV